MLIVLIVFEIGVVYRLSVIGNDVESSENYMADVYSRNLNNAFFFTFRWLSSYDRGFYQMPSLSNKE